MLEGHRKQTRTEWEKKVSKKGVRKAELGWSGRKKQQSELKIKPGHFSC